MLLKTMTYIGAELSAQRYYFGLSRFQFMS